MPKEEDEEDDDEEDAAETPPAASTPRADPTPAGLLIGGFPPMPPTLLAPSPPPFALIWLTPSVVVVRVEDCGGTAALRPAAGAALWLRPGPNAPPLACCPIAPRGPASAAFLCISTRRWNGYKHSISFYS